MAIPTLLNPFEQARLARRLAGTVPAAAAGWATADSLLDRHARRYRNNVAIAYLDERITYGELRERADQYAGYFISRGVGRGDRVALDIDNRPEFLFAFHGLQRIGAVAALINTNLRGQPLAHVIRAADPTLVVIGSEHADVIEQLLVDDPDLDPARVVVVEEEPDATKLPAGIVAINEAVDAQPTEPLPSVRASARDHCSYIYTSGTTGLPKAAIISQQKLAMSGALSGHIMHRINPGEMIYVALPLYHSSALLLGWSAALAAGAGIALRRHFSASAFFDDVRRFDARSAVYIGELCRYLLHTPVQEGERDHGLQVLVGNGMRPDVWEPFQERFGVPLIREFYGATEGTGVLVNLSGRPGMVGQLVPGSLIVRCDHATGEVVRNDKGFCEKVRPGEAGLFLGPISRAIPFDGYLDEKASSGKVLTDVLKRGDRYFNSGDLLRLHDKRWVSFIDRMGDTFRWKGENVSTNEVADLLNQAPGVVEANVYGVEISDADGRAGMAQVRVTDDFDPNALAAYVASELPNYERPLFLRIASDGIDITGTFKHQKVDARDEGFDPAVIDDPLYYLDGTRYRRLTATAFKKIESGEILPG